MYLRPGVEECAVSWPCARKFLACWLHGWTATISLLQPVFPIIITPSLSSFGPSSIAESDTHLQRTLKVAVRNNHPLGSAAMACWNALGGEGRIPAAYDSTWTAVNVVPPASAQVVVLDDDESIHALRVFRPRACGRWCILSVVVVRMHPGMLRLRTRHEA